MEENIGTPLRVQEVPPANTIEEAAALLRLRSPVPVYDLLRTGKLRSIVIGSKRLVSGASIIELLRESEQEVYAPLRVSPRTRRKEEAAA